MDQTAKYEQYRQRCLWVPGDHAPGRLLNFAQWQALCLEVAEISSQTGKMNDATEKRLRQLHWALLVAHES